MALRYKDQIVILVGKMDWIIKYQLAMVRFGNGREQLVPAKELILI